MAGDGAGRLLGQYAARAEVGRGDLSGVLRIGGRALSARESAHRARIYRGPSEGRQEAGDDTALHRDDLARTYGRASTQSLFQRSRPVGIEEDGTRNVHAGGRMEIAAHAVAICGENQRGKIRHGPGGGEDGEGLDY